MCTLNKVIKYLGVCVFVLTFGVFGALAQATVTEVELPATFTPQAVVTDVLTLVAPWVLIGGLAIVASMYVVRLIKGAGRTGAKVFKGSVALLIGSTVFGGSMAQATVTTVTLPATYTPQAVVTDVLTLIAPWVLIGGLAIVASMYVVRLIKGAGRTGAKVFKG